MAYDEGLVSLIEEDLGDLDGIERKKMFGGLVFMVQGHMVCGVHKNGVMYRVGKSRHAKALALPGAQPMQFTGRPMGGMIDVSAEGMADDGLRAQWTALALANARELPPKA